MMQVLYDFSRDDSRIKDVQNASLNTSLGLSLEHGLVGSKDWWNAIERGEIELLHFVGKVSEIIGGPMSDWPLMKLVSKNGENRNWTLFSKTDGLVGKTVVVEYVELAAKQPPYEGYVNEFVIKVFISD